MIRPMPRNTMFKILNLIRSRSIRNSTPYFELLVRDRVNQACRAVTLAFAVGSDLDAIASRYPYGVTRIQYDINGNVLTPDQIAAGATAVTSETDAVYRQRVWLSPNILSLSGPGQGTYESYKFWALSAPQFAGRESIA